MSVFGKLANAAIDAVQDKVSEVEAKNNELRAGYLERLSNEEAELPYIYRVRFKASTLKMTRSKLVVLDEAGTLVVEGKYGGWDGDFNTHTADIETTNGGGSGRIEAERTKGENAHHYYILEVNAEGRQRLEEYSEDVSSFKDLKAATSYSKYKLEPKGWMLVSEFKEGTLLLKVKDAPVSVRRVFDGDRLLMRIDVPKKDSETADGSRFIIRCANKSTLLYGVLLSIVLSHAIDRPI